MRDEGASRDKTPVPLSRCSTFPDYLKSRLPLVEAALTDAAATPLASGDAAPVADLDRYLYEPLAAFTAGGGKRVRPVLALLGAEAVGGTPEAALSAAVAVELFQSAALIHDDIADESELRRGAPCLYRTEGTGLAINAGDLALVQVFERVMADDDLPSDRKLAVLDELVRMERHTLEGQALDLGWARDERWDVTPGAYLYMVESKTAWYTCASPLRLGSVAAGGPASAADGLAKLGIHAGIAFQLQDDLLNLIGDPDAQGKDFRSDITEGKRTLAVVSALERLAREDSAARDELVWLLASGTTDSAQLARAVELIEAGGGIARCQELAASEAKAAKDAANALEASGLINSDTCAILCSMADFFVERAG